MFFITGLFIRDNDIKAQRVFGYYSTYEFAFEDVLANNCDIREFLYNFMVIEHIEEGLYQHPLGEWFFEWDEDSQGYIETMKPLFLSHYVNFSIG